MSRSFSFEPISEKVVFERKYIANQSLLLLDVKSVSYRLQYNTTSVLQTLIFVATQGHDEGGLAKMQITKTQINLRGYTV